MQQFFETGSAVNGKNLKRSKFFPIRDDLKREATNSSCIPIHLNTVNWRYMYFTVTVADS